MYFQSVTDEKVLFERWFKVPMALLRNAEHGDGGTMGLMVALPLYERFLRITKMRKEHKREFLEIMANDLELVNTDQAKEFWETFRHGFCHTGMPFDKNREGTPLPGISMSLNDSWKPVFGHENGRLVIKLDPWKFIDHVMSKYENDPSLLKSLPEAPLMGIYPVPRPTGNSGAAAPSASSAVSGSPR